MLISNNYQSQPSNTYSFRSPIFRGHKEDLSKLVTDVFQKDEPITNDVSNKIINKLKLAFQDIVKQENIMGKGFFGTVFKIDKDYVLKLFEQKFLKADAGSFKVEKGENLFKDLKTYYGEEVLRMGNAVILRNSGEHIPAGVSDEVAKKLGSRPLAHRYYETEYLPKFAKVPQSSYDDLVKDLAILNGIKDKSNMYYKIDSMNPTNIILAGDKLRIVDELDTTMVPQPNSAGRLMQMLLTRVMRMFPVVTYGEHVNDAKMIFRKIVLAVEKSELPYVAIAKDPVTINIILEKCNAKISSEDFLDKIQYLRDRNNNLSKRLEKVNKFLDEVLPLE